MKTIPTLILLAGLAAGQLFAADEPVTPDPTPTETAPVPDTAPPAPDSEAVGAAPPPTPWLCGEWRARAAPEFSRRAAGHGVELSERRGRVHHRAGTQGERQGGRVEQHAVDQDEAVNLLNSVLTKNGYTAIRNGRTLTIVNKDEAKTKNIPVKQGSDPDGIPNNDEIVTQIIPVRFVEVVQLIKDLQPLVSTATTMTANEAGNSIVITDTQANIHRVAEIIHAIDMGAEDVTEVDVFQLQFADPDGDGDLVGQCVPG